jgi:hypothetical protein
MISTTQLKRGGEGRGGEGTHILIPMFQHPGYSQSLQIKDIAILAICTYGRHVYRTV